jgi:hypothetical protein
LLGTGSFKSATCLTMGQCGMENKPIAQSRNHNS